ncbi:MAG: pyridoxamine 5'-phosphate oxidase family protein [Chloroflexota bacterium]|nr:pyridoxamine 5'-phosphate oxidase family protein [Chloroflexota bacterium]
MEQVAPIDPVLQSLAERFATSPCCWFSSVRPDGRAHSAPVWHVWLAERIYVICRADAVRVDNIQNNPWVVLAHPDPISPVIIEGIAALAPDSMPTLRPLFKKKYDWDPGASSDYDSVLAVMPSKLMAWGEFGEGRWSGEQIQKVKDVSYVLE